MARFSKTNSDETVELKVYVEHTTKAALKCIKVEDLDDENPKEFWLPLSQIEVTHIDHEKNWYTVQIPEWLAIRVGVV